MKKKTLLKFLILVLPTLNETFLSKESTDRKKYIAPHDAYTVLPEGANNFLYHTILDQINFLPTLFGFRNFPKWCTLQC